MERPRNRDAWSLYALQTCSTMLDCLSMTSTSRAAGTRAIAHGL